MYCYLGDVVTKEMCCDLGDVATKETWLPRRCGYLGYVVIKEIWFRAATTNQ